MAWDFLQFRELSPATWFYVSFVLVMAFYFRFDRFFSLRNWDYFSLFLLIPGLLASLEVDQFLASTTEIEFPRTVVDLKETAERERSAAEYLNQHPSWMQLKRFGYIWLFASSGYFILRCLVDLLFLRRPKLQQNLSIAGVVFVSVILFSYLIVIITRDEPESAGRSGARVASSLLSGDTALPQYAGADPATVLFMMPSAAVQRGFAGAEDGAKISEDSVYQDSVARSALILCHLLLTTGLVVIGWQHYQSLATAMAMVMLYLLVPATYMSALKLDQLIPATLIVWSVYFYRVPIVSGILHGLASVSFFPLFLLPLWMGFYWRRGFKRFTICFLGMTLVLWILVYLVPPLLSFVELWTTSLSAKVLVSPQSAPSTVGFWDESTQIYRLPIAVVFGVFVLAAAFIPREKTLADLISLSAALLLMIQFWYADRGGTYVMWYLPLLILMIFRPNLSEAVAPIEERAGEVAPSPSVS